MDKPVMLELLSPARDAATALAAVDHGADAVYIGAPHHGARSSATNSIDDISRVVEYAHAFGVKVYVTLNTLVYDSELESVRSLVWELYRAGVDALIVQDLGLLEMNLPPIALHASTQCDIVTPGKARFLEDAGFSQLVLARELTLEEIRRIRCATTVPLEAFVHGALCVSYSGNCQASFALTGRSANRGECAQICRLAYDLVDGDGRVVMAGKHLLSLRDMNRRAYLGAMIDAGVTSFKIEGRLKDMSYVKTVTAAYRRALDEIIEAGGGRYARSSLGESTVGFTPRFEQSFNRGFTDYFLNDRRPQPPMASVDTPKSVGECVGKVLQVKGNCVKIKAAAEINNGDGLSYFRPDGRLDGFRVNRADGDSLYLTDRPDVAPGTMLYRNYDSALSAAMSRATAARKIDVDLVVRPAGRRAVALDISLDSDPKQSAAACVECELAPATTDQREARRRALMKFGDTIYTPVGLDDRCGDLFVPLSVLSRLRREAVAALDKARRASYRYDYRRPSAGPQSPALKLDYYDNVANRLSRQFYTRAGAVEIKPSLETSGRVDDGMRVMLTRYCLRRELGACLRSGGAGSLKGPLKLRGANFCMNIDFDCSRCEMSVSLARNPK